MSEITGTARNDGENNNGLGAPNMGNPFSALEPGENVTRPQDHGERLAQLLECCNVPEGKTRRKIKKISTHSELIVLISDMQNRPNPTTPSQPVF